MILLEAPDVLVVAGRVLGRSSEEVLSDIDLALVDPVLSEAEGAADDPRDDDAFGAVAATLLFGFVRHRPFGPGNDAVAMACLLQFAALNERELRMDPPDQVLGFVDRIRTGEAELADVVAWVRGRVVEPHRSKREQGMSKRRRRHEAEADLNRFADRFTERARRSVDLAHDEARATGRSGVAPEHLVLGMLRVPESVGARALLALGATLEAARADLGRRPGRPDSVGECSRMDPGTKWVLQLAAKEAAQLDDDHIGTEHILLALSHLPVVCSGPAGASRVLPGLGLTMGRVRREVFRALIGMPGGAEHPDRESVVEQITATFDENERLRSEVARLHAILRERGIAADGGASESA
jgi:prophage maintenance system killer protein